METTCITLLFFLGGQTCTVVVTVTVVGLKTPVSCREKNGDLLTALLSKKVYNCFS